MIPSVFVKLMSGKTVTYPLPTTTYGIPLIPDIGHRLILPDGIAVVDDVEWFLEKGIIHVIATEVPK